MKYSINLPNPYDPEAPSIEYAIFPTEADALRIAKHIFGCDQNGLLQIVFGESEEEEN